MTFEFDEAAMQRMIDDAAAKLQVQANQHLQDVIREVNADMSGQPAEAVYDRLVARLQQEIPGLQVDEPNLRKVAQEISDGTVTD